MRCSDCSAHIPPVVAVDIDGTLSDYHDEFFRFCTKYCQLEKPAHGMYTGGPEGSWGEFIMRTFSLNRAEYERAKQAYRMGSFKRWQTAFPGAADFVQTASRFAEVWVTTSRPYLNHDTIDPDTKFWLETHKIPYGRILYDEDKYGVLHNNVDPMRVVAIVEDLPEQYDRAAELFGLNVPILRKTHWNESIERTNEVATLGEAKTLVLKRVAEWGLH